MKQNFTKYFLWIIPLTAVFFVNFTFAKAASLPKIDTTDIHIQKTKGITGKSPYKNGLHLALPPLKPAAVSNTKIIVAHPDDKLLNNVQIYPNPITDQINLKYALSRNANVTIKVMDVLGNNIITVLSQRIGAGEQTYNYALNNQLPRGFYFVRIVAGTESVIKRISVL